jgi:hypothetical protein
MSRKILYAIAALAVIVIISGIAIQGDKSERSAERQGTAAVQGAGATPIQVHASSSPIAATKTAPIQPHYGVRTKTNGCVANQALPDPACSAGAVLTTDTSVICVSGYTQTVRDVPLSEKEQGVRRIWDRLVVS